MATVFVGLSGGVDSAVSAALLKERGHTVVGAFIKIWQPEFTECSWREDRLDAMRVCAALDIPFREIDLSDEYKKEVVATMVADYASGITPNPDVLCNRKIKFGSFAAWAQENGADMIATGHYARVQGSRGHFKLLRAKDVTKDQSYFLYRLGQRDLARVMFPVGEYAKSDVRRTAKKFGLPVAQKPDSQGLCFIGEVSMKDFLSRYIAVEPGNVVDQNGAVIGTHDGAVLYTIGERHGFAAQGGAAQYVIGIDVGRNVVRVSPRRTDAARTEVPLSDMHWIGDPPALPARLEVQARYHEVPGSATIVIEDGSPFAVFDSAHIAAAGQSLVFYEGAQCLGGAIIAA